MTLRALLFSLSLCVLTPSLAHADPAPFDLAGPALQVMVTHGGESLPISAVPNLAFGDVISIKADLPADQSAHYLLVLVFLRGATNPPPKNWFYRAESWTKKGRNGLQATVPAGAQQVVVLLAPETGGDIDTLVGAVRGRPGAFVRASQDLNQVALDRSRLDAFLDGIHKRDPADPDRLARVSPLLARSLAIKLNADCLQRVPELQSACLTQNQDSLVLNDGHSTSITEALAAGPTADLALQISATPQAGLGYYSPYIAAIRDIVGILGSFHTAQYQYIPALGMARDDRLALVLNAVPSFHNPKSVLMTALPAVGVPAPPPLLSVTMTNGLCAQRPGLILPVEGAPLIYSARYARDMVLHLRSQNGELVDLPIRADAEQGGFVVDTTRFDPAHFGATIEGSLRGYWGFEPFDGPRFRLENAQMGSWQPATEDQQSLIVGRDETLHLEGGPAACVQEAALRQQAGETQALQWKATGPGALAVTIPLANASPGAMTLLVKHYGTANPASVPLRAYEEAGHIEGFTFNADDLSGILAGNRLDEVASLDLGGGIVFKPAGLTRAGGGDRLQLIASSPQAAADLKAGQSRAGKLMFADGRTIGLKVTIGPPRPKAVLIAKSVQLPTANAPISIHLGGDSEFPQDARLAFSVRAGQDTSFTGEEAIEVAAADGTASTTLTSQGGLTRASAQVVLATLDPGKMFGPSIFGPLRFRIVQGAISGDWQPLATLVRLPSLRDLKCDGNSQGPCVITGANLFLIDSVSADSAFGHPVLVPEGFTGTTLQVPRPTSGRLYLKLRDTPQSIDELILPAS